jgi:hypothetical protein
MKGPRACEVTFWMLKVLAVLMLRETDRLVVLRTIVIRKLRVGHLSYRILLFEPDRIVPFL